MAGWVPSNYSKFLAKYGPVKAFQLYAKGLRGLQLYNAFRSLLRGFSREWQAAAWDIAKRSIAASEVYNLGTGDTAPSFNIIPIIHPLKEITDTTAQFRYIAAVTINNPETGSFKDISIVIPSDIILNKEQLLGYLSQEADQTIQMYAHLQAVYGGTGRQITSVVIQEVSRAF